MTGAIEIQRVLSLSFTRFQSPLSYDWLRCFEGVAPVGGIIARSHERF